MDDAEIAEIQNKAIALCQKIDTVSILDPSIREQLFRKLFGSVGKNPSIKPGFRCDLGVNIHIGDNFLTNYNVMILDMATGQNRHCAGLPSQTERRRETDKPGP